VESGQIRAFYPDHDGRRIVDLPRGGGPPASRAATVSHSSIPSFRPTLYLSIASMIDDFTASV
jgi:hypothetical protein